MAHQGLEDALAGGERLGRGLRCFEVRALGGEGTACCGDLGRFGRRDVGPATTRTSGAVVVTWGRVARPVITAGAAVVTAGRPATAVITAGAAVAVLARAVVLAGRSVVVARGRRGQWLRGRGIAFRGCTAEGAPWRGDDAGRLRAHPQHATAPGREDLEIEVVELGPEFVASGFEGLLDGLA